MQQQARFVGVVVIVTGAGRGIGRAIAERFGREGARVVVNDIGAHADDVALALTSDDAPYITGQTIVVDGGLLSQQRSPQVDIFPLDRYPKIDKEKRP